MNARTKKEIRLMLPFLGTTFIVLISASWLLNGSDAADIVRILFTGCCALMGAASFGVEFQSRTMTQWLAQPVSRWRLWLEKMVVLGAALLIAYLIMVMEVGYIIKGEGKPGDVGEFARAAGAIAICAFCSAPGITLFCRNLIGGVVFTIFAPFALFAFILLPWAAIRYFTPQHTKDAVEFWYLMHDNLKGFVFHALNEHLDLCLTIPISIYCFVFYRMGSRKFLRFQVVDGQSTDLQIKFPKKIEPALGMLAKRLLPGFTNPTASLVRKELQLNQLSYVLAAIFVILLIVLGIGWKLYPTELALVPFWAMFALYSLSIPVIVGAMSMAEERHWGTMAGQLTLPVSTRFQAGIKMLVSATTVLLLGILVPSLMLDAGKTILHLPVYGFLTAPGFEHDKMIGLTIVYFLCVAIIMFASSCSSNSIKALTLAVGLIIACSLAAFGTSHGMEHLRILNILPKFAWSRIGNGEIPAYILFSAIIILIAGLTFLNFQKAEIGSKRAFANSGLIVCAIGFAMVIMNVFFV